MRNHLNLRNLRPGVVALAFAVLPFGLSAQSRTVLSNSLAISGTDAAMHLELEGGRTLDLALSDGVVLIDGEQVGVYTRGDDLDMAWRSFLGQITPLDDGPLGAALVDWDPTGLVTGDDLEIARLLDEAMEATLALDAVASVQIEASDDGISVGARVDLSQLEVLSEAAGLSEIIETLREMQIEEIKVYIGEDVVVEADTEIVGTVVVLEGDLTVAGTIRGDVIISGGAVAFRDEGYVDGSIRLSDARVLDYQRENVAGDVVSFEDDDEDRLEDRIRAEIRSELRNEIRNVSRTSTRSIFRPFRALGHGISALVGDLVQFLILSAIAFAVIFFAKDNLEVVAQTARYSPARAGMVGLAGAFLVLPTWILGCVALAISIVGIIALPFWILLFPLVAAFAAGLGYMAVARNIGEWVAGQGFRGFEWVRASNTLYATVTGIGALVAFSVVGHLVGILPIIGIFKGLFLTAGTLATAAAIFIGFGAVLLTRGGRQPEFYEGDWSGGVGTSADEDIDEEVVVAEEVVDDEGTEPESADDSESTTADDDEGSKEEDDA